MQPRLTDIKYKLPDTVQALQSGWMLTFQSAAVVSALLAGIESQLLGTISDAVHGDGGIGETTVSGRCLLIITYLALFLSLSATMSSLILTQELSIVAVRAARFSAAGDRTIGLDLYDEGTVGLLSRFNGKRGSWKWVLCHWLIALIASYIALVIQLVLYVWCTEQPSVKATVIVISILTSLPLFGLLPAPSSLLTETQNLGQHNHTDASVENISM